jgi:C-terminal processing protease CtpA/Prc
VVQTGVSFKKALSATLPHLVRPYDSRILQDKLGYLDIRSLSGDTGHFRAFLDTSFLQFQRAGIRCLAIDLRKNSGGSTTLGDLLFSYITTKKYSWGAKSWKISQAYKNYLLAGGDTGALYLKKPNGTVWMSGDSCIPEANPFKTTMLFKGEVFFLTGPFTFSSAMDIADVVKEYKIGTIVGEPTGEYVKDFGEAFVIDLPNSKIKIQSTSSFNHGVSCSREQNGPVQPDIAVHNTLQEEVLGKDKALEYLLNRIP